MSNRIRLWSSGFEFDCWDEANCSQCVKAGTDDTPPACELYDAITESMATDGALDAEIVARFGWQEEYRAVLGWPCREFQAEGPVLPPSAAHEMAKAGATPLPGFDRPGNGQPAGVTP